MDYVNRQSDVHCSAQGLCADDVSAMNHGCSAFGCGCTYCLCQRIGTIVAVGDDAYFHDYDRSSRVCSLAFEARTREYGVRIDCMYRLIRNFVGQAGNPAVA